MTRTKNILGWCFLWWQIPVLWLLNRVPFFVNYNVSQVWIWFKCWHTDKPIIYTKSQRENLKRVYGEEGKNA